ncbi:MAG: P-II family nitrogen regulator [Oscillatoriales cyanobacterium RM1_1_9]|nr:P-II family nitrogen regulator [Oscillatoriales cyanobacterium SM2_3_0]NJO45210.1 P-II family nitrogen regulator [Oscillatoriales cyanobacterium RM2_1_1]NJO71329.1 P-II family nitrogen regulator [Oscillatoriales cyanobacterium RM1_1_9]
MHLVKRLEIIVSSRELPKILKPLDEAGVPGYSVIRDVTGKNDWGAVSDDSDFAATTLSNVYILAFCSEDQTKRAIEQVRPVLNKLGGVCYVSDAMEVHSLRCIASL